MSVPTIRLEHTKHVLANGLEVVLFEDHADAVVSVYVYYHVGSSREEAGKSGFAHLFEHMLFQGSEHVPDNDHFRLLQEAGGTLNGTTNQDRTNYYETVPANHLELALWLESDRMGFLLPAMTQAKLDNQRDVVMNERRQSYENRPYGLVHETLLEALYPAGHPYSWPTIGSMADIEAATLEDVSRFFRRWYGPNNATLVVGGDIDPEATLELVERYFGDLERGPTVPVPAPQPAELAETQRRVLEDDVQLPQLSLCWPGVERAHPDAARLDLLTDVLSANRSSILDDLLMVRTEEASSITIANHMGERAGFVVIQLRPVPGISLDRLRERVDDAIAAFCRDGVAEDRLERLKTRRMGAWTRRLETVAGRASELGLENCLGGRPDRVQERFDALQAVTVADLVTTARRYLLARPRVELSVVPRDRTELALQEAPVPVRPIALDEVHEDLDRSSAPGAAPEPPFRAPEVWTARTAGGARIHGTPVTSVPLTRLSFAVPAGRLFDGVDSLGRAELAARMIAEGTGSLDGTELVDVLDGLGADLGLTATEDEIVLQASVLDAHRGELASLLAELVAAPRFAQEDFERVRRQLLVELSTRDDQPRAIAQDVFRRLVHGAPSEEGVAGAPRLGTRATIEALSVEDVAAFWTRCAGGSGARLSFASAAGPEELLHDFEALVGHRDAAPGPTPRTPESPAASSAGVYLVDHPGAEQSELRVGHRGLSRLDEDWFPAYVMNHALGGAFTSRINLNLREDKGYTYGARSEFHGARTPGWFQVSTAVETKTTAAALGEIQSEIAGFLEGGLRAEEVEYARLSIARSLRRAFESGAARLQLVEAVSKYGWPSDYPQRRLAYLDGLERSALDALARRWVRPEERIVLVVGDRARVEPELQALGWGPVRLLDRSGEAL